MSVHILNHKVTEANHFIILFPFVISNKHFPLSFSIALFFAEQVSKSSESFTKIFTDRKMHSFLREIAFDRARIWESQMHVLEKYSVDVLYVYEKNIIANITFG